MFSPLSVAAERLGAPEPYKYEIPQDSSDVKRQAGSTVAQPIGIGAGMRSAGPALRALTAVPGEAQVVLL
jgi:hypothetical protein